MSNRRKSNGYNAQYEANELLMKEKNYLCSTLLLGYLRPVWTMTMIENEYDLFRWFSKDIEALCCRYFDHRIPKLSINPLKFTKLSRKSNVLQIYDTNKIHEEDRDRMNNSIDWYIK